MLPVVAVGTKHGSLASVVEIGLLAFEKLELEIRVFLRTSADPPTTV